MELYILLIFLCIIVTLIISIATSSANNKEDKRVYADYLTKRYWEWFNTLPSDYMSYKHTNNPKYLLNKFIESVVEKGVDIDVYFKKEYHEYYFYNWCKKQEVNFWHTINLDRYETQNKYIEYVLGGGEHEAFLINMRLKYEAKKHVLMTIFYDNLKQKYGDYKITKEIFENVFNDFFTKLLL